MAIPRCEAIPVPEHAVSFRVDGVEKVCWRFSPAYPGPYFYPVLGPSGVPLTRMGHPGAENHDHHRSVWFAHHSVMGIDFWSMGKPSSIRQRRWYEYRDDETECGMAVELEWFDGHDPAPLMRQNLIVFLRPLADGEYTLDLHSTLIPTAAELELQQSNFGLLAIRVAKSLSAHFGGGVLTGASGGLGEPALHGEPNVWMDYSGPIAVLLPDGTRESRIEGITCFDHPGNPAHPAKWHVRDDGWMGASACRDQSLLIPRMGPLVLRYLLHVHRGPVDAQRANDLAAQFATWPGYRVVKATKPHRQFEIERTT